MVMTTGAPLDLARESRRDASGHSRGGRPRRIPGLFDLALVVAPDGGLALARWPDRSLTGAQLAELVRDGGGQGFDVRLAVAAGAQTLPTIVAMARELDRDVLVAPAGSELRHVPAIFEPNSPSGRRPGDETGEGDNELMPVDLATGYPVDWVIVQPSGQETSTQGWYELVGGLVLERVGTVALPLPGGGLALTTRDDFVRCRAAAAELRPGHPALSTVAVGVASGDFVLGDYGGGVSRCDGRQLAAALASLPLYGSALRLWLSWPDAIEERRRLRLNLALLAATTGATVWAPAEGGRVEILDGCRDLSVVDRDARPGRWEPHGNVDGAAFQSDVDGRLAPVGGVVTTGCRGVPLVSVPAAQEQETAARYESLRPTQAVFRVDLAVLADGRLALRYRDDSLLAVGPQQLRLLLEQAGWRGADLMLLSRISPERSAGARHHADSLARHIAAGISFTAAPGVGPAPEAVAAPAQPTAPRSSSTELIAGDRMPARLDAGPLPAVQLAASAAGADRTTNVRTTAASPERDENKPPDDDPLYGLAPPVMSSRFIDGPRLTQAPRAAAWHGLTWLPPQPQVNAEQCDLFVESAADPGLAAAGIPSANLFLLGHLDANRLALRTEHGYLLALRIDPGGAVDVAASEVTPPPALAAALRERDVYVLPAGWLDRCRLVAGLRVVRGGRLLPQNRFVDLPVTLLSRGAAHGIPGLPNEVQRWPHGGLRTTISRYVMVKEDSPDGLGPWQRLHQQRPPAVTGHRLLEVRVGRERAINVANTARALAGLSRVQTTLSQLLADRADHVVPVASYPYTQIEQEFRADRGSWQRIRSGGPRTLDAWCVAPS